MRISILACFLLLLRPVFIYADDKESSIWLPPCFIATSLQKDEVYLNLILEFVPETLYQLERQHTKANKAIPILHVKVACNIRVHVTCS